jgi:hypothetical protein
VGLTLERLPRFLVLAPVSTVRLELRRSRPLAELDVELENPGPGRTFLLLVGPEGGPVLRRLRLGGGARILFDPRERRAQVLMVANPQKEPLVLQLRARPVGRRGPRVRARARPAVPRVARAPPHPPRGPARVRLAPEAVGATRAASVVGGLGGSPRRARPKG